MKKIFIVVLLLIPTLLFGYTKVINEEGTYLDAKVINATGTNLDVILQDQTSRPITLYMTNDIVIEPTITAAAEVGAYTIDVDDSTGVATDGTHAIEIYENGRIFQSIVTASTATSITFSAPLDMAVDAGSAVEISAWDMTVDGSSTAVVYAVRVPDGVTWDITSINFSMTGTATMDDAKFGPLTALTNGIVVRHKDSYYNNLMSITNNAGFFEHGCDDSYPAKVPAGTYAYRARKKYAGQDNNGVAIRLTAGDELQIIIQDDLEDVTFTKFACVVMGHEVVD